MSSFHYSSRSRYLAFAAIYWIHVSRLPYVLKTNVSGEEYLRRTDFFNVHGCWEWEAGTVRVYEVPSAPHDAACRAVERSVTDAIIPLRRTDDDLIGLGSMSE